jgi:hypothetical protein
VPHAVHHRQELHEVNLAVAILVDLGDELAQRLPAHARGPRGVHLLERDVQLRGVDGAAAVLVEGGEGALRSRRVR